MTTVLITGNCQARPLASLFAQLEGVEATKPIIVQETRDEDRDAHQAAFAKADLILAQWNAPTFNPAHLRVQEIKAAYPDKTVVWPNLFFAGQQPHLCYVTTAQGRCMGPMDANHDLRFLRQWFRDRFDRDFAPWIEAPDFADRAAEISLSVLRDREAACDVGVSDLVEKEYRTRRLFFTFNHPVIWLLTRLGNRILERIGQAAQLDLPADGAREPLGRFTPPALEQGPSDALYLGSDVTLAEHGKVIMGKHRKYGYSELRETYFQCYDHQQEVLLDDTLRLTPAFPKIHSGGPRSQKA